MPFKKGRKKTGGRKAGVENRLTSELKEILVNAYHDLGGYKRFLEWVESTPERLDYFYTRLWIKLLPMNIKVGDHKNVTYKSYSELRVAFARHGISMELSNCLSLIFISSESD